MKKLGILTLLLPFFYASFCQYRVIPYERIFDQPGLNDHFIRCIMQDKKGFIWFGGANGIHRYDGYNLVYYKDLPGCKDYPCLFYVCDLVEDDQGVLWIISFYGISTFNPETGESRMIKRFGEQRYNPFSRPLDLCKDVQGNIWASGETGLYRYSYPKKNVKMKTETRGSDVFTIHTDVFHLSQDTNSAQNKIIKIFEDQECNLWIRCMDGICILRKGDSLFHRLEINVSTKYWSSEFFEIAQENTDTFWIIPGRNYMMTNVRRALQDSVPDGKALNFKNLGIATTRSARILFKDKKNRILYGEDNDVSLLKRKNENNRFTLESLYKSMLEKPEYIITKDPWCMFEDRTGTLWTGHRTFGILKFNLDRSQFISYKDMISNTFTGTDITNIRFDSEENLWLGAWGSGLYKFQKEKCQITRFDLGPDNAINCFEEVYQGIFWLGLSGGISEFNTLTGKSHDPLPKGRIAEILRRSAVWDLLKVENQLYISTWSGLFIYDFNTHQLLRYENKGVNSSILLKNGDILVVSLQNGILKFRYDPKTDSIFAVCLIEDSILRYKNKLTLDRCRIFQDSQGSLWMVEKAGLHKIDPEKGEIIHYRLFKDIEYPQAESIIEDDHGNLWIGTHFGLCRFNIHTGQLKNFTKEDGLPIIVHQIDAVTKDKDGRFYFAGFGGFYDFHPDSIKDNTYVPTVVITDFRLFNKSVRVDSTKKAILKHDITYTNRIELRYNQNDVSFEFAALDYTLPSRNMYAYKLEGYQDEWVETHASNRIANYTNLNPGKYVFRVKGSNNDGVWNEEGTFINIIIHPPFWRTILAYIVYGILFILLLWGYIYWRTNQLRKEKNVLEKQVSERTQKIEQQKEELNVANIQLEKHQEELQELNTFLEEQKEELMQQKEELQSTLENLQKTQEQLVETEKMAAIGGLVTGVAHEINTPVGIGITAISNLLDDIQKMTGLFEKDEISRKDFKEFLQSSHDVSRLIQKNLERTASLVQSFKQVSADQASEQQRVFELKDYLNDILLSLRPKFREKKIEFKVECDDELRLDSYPGVFAQIFTNLLLNSLQHGFHKKVAGTIGIKADMNKELLKIEYSDDGAGISKKDLPHIFEPFYASDQYRGTGLGLNIIYNLIRQKLHGTITCESEPEKGVLFKIEVPNK